jgi:hypothetical protein
MSIRGRVLKLSRLALVAVAALALGACERTVFQNPPAVAAAACDPDLVGRWLSEGDTPEDRGEMEAIIDADCGLVTIEHKQDGPRRSAPTTLHLAKVDGQHYAWFDAAWAHSQFEVDSNLLDQPGDVYLYAYRVKGSRLSLAAPPHRKLARQVIDRDVSGEVLVHDDTVTVRIEGDADAIRAMLRKRKPFRFDGESLRFVRAPGATP